MLPVGTPEADTLPLYYCTSAAGDGAYRAQQVAVTVVLCTFLTTEQRHLMG
jgi:hypothetical protein